MRYDYTNNYSMHYFIPAIYSAFGSADEIYESNHHKFAWIFGIEPAQIRRRTHYFPAQFFADI